MARHIFLLGLLLLTACATRSNYDSMLQSWVGVSSDELVNVWGGPDSIYTRNDGVKLMTYNSTRIAATPGYGVFGSNNGFGFGTAFPAYDTETRRCKTTFYVSTKREVTGYTFSGDDCMVTNDLMQQKSYGWTPKRP